MPPKIEVEPEVASMIQARAQERGVSVDVYPRELIDQEGTESKTSSGRSPQERVVAKVGVWSQFQHAASL